MSSQNEQVLLVRVSFDNCAFTLDGKNTLTRPDEYYLTKGTKAISSTLARSRPESTSNLDTASDMTETRAKLLKVGLLSVSSEEVEEALEKYSQTSHDPQSPSQPHTPSGKSFIQSWVEWAFEEKAQITSEQIDALSYLIAPVNEAAANEQSLGHHTIGDRQKFGWWKCSWIEDDVPSVLSLFIHTMNAEAWIKYTDTVAAQLRISLEEKLKNKVHPPSIQAQSGKGVTLYTQQYAAEGAFWRGDGSMTIQTTFMNFPDVGKLL